MECSGRRHFAGFIVFKLHITAIDVAAVQTVEVFQSAPVRLVAVLGHRRLESLPVFRRRFDLGQQPGQIVPGITLCLGRIAQFAVTGDDDRGLEAGERSIEGAQPTADPAPGQHTQHTVHVDQIAAEQDSLSRQPHHRITGKMRVTEPVQFNGHATQDQRRAVALDRIGTGSGLGAGQPFLEHGFQAG